jgi:hypothetical protein
MNANFDYDRINSTKSPSSGARLAYADTESHVRVDPCFSAVRAVEAPVFAAYIAAAFVWRR